MIEEKFIKEIKKYKDVIIYGYADIAVTVLDYIIEIDTSIKIANYSGRVKYFTTSERIPIKKRDEIKGIKIRPIYDLTDYAADSLVVVATKEMHHKAIAKTLDELGFKNILFISHEQYCLIRESVENFKTVVNNNIQNYHLNHQIKLDRLRDKVKRGGRVKAFFMTHDSAVFGCASVYKAMEESKLFDPYIYVVSRRDVEYPKFLEDVDRDVNFFEERGYKVIKGYDDNGNPRDLHTLNPDILFYDIPKLYGSAGSSYNRLDQLNWEYLTCYVPYGMMMVDSFYYHYHTKCIRETWKFFVDTTSDFKRALMDSDFNGFNTVLAGYPKLDEYGESKTNAGSTKEYEGKKIVIYAPHHSLFASNNFATFDLYKDHMLEIVKQNPKFYFVIKPHPLLKFQINARFCEGKIDFSKEDYEKYLEEWDKLPNGEVVDQGDYIELFEKSYCMITDCGSFIGEYFPSGKPCIYLFNPRKERQRDVYTPLAQKILDTYYIANSQDELDKYVLEVIKNGNDIKAQARNKAVSEEFPDIGHAGRTIVKYLEDVLI